MSLDVALGLARKNDRKTRNYNGKEIFLPKRDIIN